MTNSDSKAFVVGLTGGIGSGKSAATERFAALGASIVDTDDIAHELTAPNAPAIAPIREAFGAEVVDARNALDRKAMREKAFSDARVRRRLEEILHPMIRAESRRRCERARTPYVILAVPLLLESDYWPEQCQRICVVDCPEALQISRVRARSKLDEAQIRAIMAAQASRAERLAAADDVLDNSGTLAELHEQIDRLHGTYLRLAGQVGTTPHR